MIYGYIRVSSDKQTVENQRFEINNFCERENIKIDGWIEETISGTKAYNKRQLGTLLRRVPHEGERPSTNQYADVPIAFQSTLPTRGSDRGQIICRG